MSPDSIHPSSEELFAYRDGELPADRRALIEAHVIGCHACRGLIDRVSGLEAGLRLRPDQVEGDYYARLSSSVLERIGTGTAESSVAVPKPAAAGGPPRATEARLSRAPRFPWAAVVSTAAAAAAVVVVAVVLLQQGALRRPQPQRAVVRAPAAAESSAPADAESAAPEAETPLAQTPPAANQPGGHAASITSPGKAAPEGVGSANRIAARSKDGDQLAALAKGAEQPAARSNGADQLLARAKEEKAAPERLDASAKSAPRATGELTAPAEPEPARASRTAATAPPATGRSPYQALLLRHGLPPVWAEGRVAPQALLAAERELRTLYQAGGAGADSAGVRLYLAEAARLAYETSPDSSLYDRIVHHYLRALRLAGPESDVGRIARERLQSFSR
jgi:anti-sigma factor RsiW